MTENGEQRIVRVAGSRRARLTPVPGTDPEPETGEKPERPAVASEGKGPNDDRLRQDVPPHY
ncbi:hypothetical protein QFZ53_003297 [Microbacterium natoriense]|uniref:Uncharacterized protein n=1 Tax=Microbacterium natoriense TaxID=284570 RepID=A0AAW8F0G8_9MICO|nr:hypothetical protein [Microbacterium natoriense]MDQ0649101.1 hypothetical protein [Microbacterium natoriense]